MDSRLRRNDGQGLSEINGAAAIRIISRGVSHIRPDRATLAGVAVGRSEGKDGRAEPTGAAETQAARHAGPGGFCDRRRAATRAGRGPGVAARHLSVARPLYARPDQRRALLCQAGRDRRRHRRPRRRSGRRARAIPASREGEYVFGGYGWQLYSAVDGARAAQARPRRGAALDRARRARHAGLDRLCRSRRYRSAARPAKPSSSRPPRGRSARWPGKWPSATARGSSASPAAPTNAAMSRRSSASTPASTIARPISARRSTPPARRASTSISRMSAARCSRRCFRGSTISAAW